MIGSPRATSIMARSVSAPHERPEIRLQSELAVAFACRQGELQSELARREAPEGKPINTVAIKGPRTRLAPHGVQRTPLPEESRYVL